MTNALAVLDHVQQKLATITTLEAAKQVRDEVATLQHYVKVTKQSLRNQNAVARVKFQCERRGGELLLQVPKVQGQRAADDGLVLTIRTSGLSLQTAYRWMDLARMPEAELLHGAAMCDADEEELTATLVHDVLVRQWKERHGAPVSKQAAPPRDVNHVHVRQDLLQWKLLDADDLRDLSPETERTLIMELRGTYEDYCEDLLRGKVAEGEWNPPVLVDRALLRTKAREIVRDLEAGKITATDVRHRLRSFLDSVTLERRPVSSAARAPEPTRRRSARDPVGELEARLQRVAEAIHRLIAETRALLAPRDLLEERVILSAPQRDRVVTWLAEGRTALDALEAKMMPSSPHSSDG